MKKTLILLLALALLLPAGCSKKASDDGNAPGETAETAAPEVSPSPDAAPETTENPDMPAQQTANPTPTPTPVADSSQHISQMYIDIIKSNNYFMKAKVEGVDGVNEFAVSVSGDSTAMETATGGVLYNTVIKDGITYMIDHQNQLVITSSVEVASSASNMAGSKLRTDGITFSKNGAGSFNGENLSFDEYTKSDGGIMRFYFRSNALAGIESIDNGETTNYIIEEISSGSRASMHEIPSSYQLLDMASLGG